MLRVDAIPSWSVLLAAGVVLVALSVVGGWVGFQIGDMISAIEDANCVGVCGYLFKPRTYIALGAALVPNCISLVFNIAYVRRVRTQGPVQAAGRPINGRRQRGPASLTAAAVVSDIRLNAGRTGPLWALRHQAPHHKQPRGRKL